MKQIIPFEHLIDFKTNLASITSISLEHEENIKKGEVNGDFIVYGNYKEHTDTTEEELFKYRIPYTAIIPDNISLDTVSIDVNNFTYEIIENKTLKVNIDFTLLGKEMIVVPQEDDRKVETVQEEVVSEEKEETPTILEETPKIIEEMNSQMRSFDEVEQPNTLAQLNSIEPANNMDHIKITEEKEKEEQKMIEETKIEETKDVEIEQKNEIIKEKEEEKIEVIDEEFITYQIHIVAENETLEQIMKKYETTLDNVKEYNDITNIKIGDKIIIPQILND